MKDYKVIFDLSSVLTGGHPFSGIPQELRMLFKLFAESERVHPTGMLCSIKRESATYQFQKHNDQVKQTLGYTDFFLRQEDIEKPKNILKYIFFKMIEFSKLPKNIIKSHYGQYKYPKEFDDYIWRKCFNNCIDSRYKDLILSQKFTLSDYNKFLTNVRTMLNLPTTKLDTEGYDFAIFSNGVPQSPIVSKGTIPIVRFHDIIPLLYPDTVSSFTYSKLHAKSLVNCSKHAVFVCNSPPTREDLLRLAPELEKKSFVVPIPILTDSNASVNKSQKLDPQIIAARMAKSSSSSKINFDPNTADYSNYIISVSTLEPRKNFVSLVRAWERVRFEHDKNLKLIIVGSFGWKYQAIYDAMAPHINSGNIIHLEKVPVDELRMLYACARAFVFPTYCEGYGNTPIEAMHAGCPAIVSDIPTVRWVLGDGAMYCNPYDIGSIADAIARLLYSSESKQLSEELVKKGYKTIEKYSPASIANQWLSVFDTLKST